MELAVDRLGGLAGRPVLVVGAGDMGAGVATSLRKSGATDITVANRTADRSRTLAASIAGDVVAFEQLAGALANSDVAVTCVADSESLITSNMLSTRRVVRC